MGLLSPLLFATSVLLIIGLVSGEKLNIPKKYRELQMQLLKDQHVFPQSHQYFLDTRYDLFTNPVLIEQMVKAPSFQKLIEFLTKQQMKGKRMKEIEEDVSQQFNKVFDLLYKQYNQLPVQTNIKEELKADIGMDVGGSVAEEKTTIETPKKPEVDNGDGKIIHPDGQQVSEDSKADMGPQKGTHKNEEMKGEKEEKKEEKKEKKEKKERKDDQKGGEVNGSNKKIDAKDGEGVVVHANGQQTSKDSKAEMGPQSGKLRHRMVAKRHVANGKEDDDDYE